MTEHILETNIKACKTAKEKQELKNREFKKIKTPFMYAVDGLDIEILSIKDGEKETLEVQLNVFKNGEIINVNAPFLFKNPPVKVPNGTFRKELVDGEEKDIENTGLNILEALKRFVLDTIKTQLK